MERSETGPLGGGAFPIVQKAYVLLGLFNRVKLIPVIGLFKVTGQIFTFDQFLMLMRIN